MTSATTQLSMPARLMGQIGRLRTGTGLKQRAARGGLWLASGSGFENGLRITRNMILTRMLLPEAFGLMAIVLAIASAFESFTEIGLKEAVIQSPQGTERKYLNAAWWLAFLRGLMLYALAFTLAPWLASFYNQPALTPMLRLAFLSIALNGAMSPGAYVALKQMNYRPWVIISHGGAAVGIVTTAVLGILYKNVWALVIGFVAESAAKCLLSYVLCPVRPRASVDRASLKALFAYASGMVGLPILTMLYAKSDVFVVGKLLGPNELGLYSMASSLAYIPDVLCVSVIAPILMPAFSSMQDNREVLLENMLVSLKYMTLIFLPGLTLLACFARPILGHVYGPEYATVGIVFALLCMAMAVKVAGLSLVTVFFATGRPHLGRQASLVRLVALVALLIPLVKFYGLAGAALAILFSGVAWVAHNVFYLRRTHHLRVPRYFAALGQGALASVVIMALWAIFR